MLPTKFSAKLPPTFRATQDATSLDEDYCIAVDTKTGTLCLMKLEKRGFFFREAEVERHWLIKGAGIVAVGLVDVNSGVTITQTDRTSQALGTIVGGALFGGVGALIGGVTGKKESHHFSSGHTILRITINDLKTPVHLLNLGNEANEYWHGIISVLVRRSLDTIERQRLDAQSVQSSQRQAVNANSNFSVADELTKLAKLFEQGLLTKDELSRLKQQLLSQSDHVQVTSLSPPTWEEEANGKWKKIQEKKQAEIAKLEAERKEWLAKEKEIIARKGVHHFDLTECVYLPDNKGGAVALMAEHLASGANPNDTGDDDAEGMPVLQLAIRYCETEEMAYEMVKLLIEHGADVNAESEYRADGNCEPDRVRAIDICSARGDRPMERVRELLIQSGAIVAST